MDLECTINQELEQPLARKEANSFHQQPERRPFPTDSMVTVRLSEISMPSLTTATTISVPEALSCTQSLDSTEPENLFNGKLGPIQKQNDKVSSGMNAMSDSSVERESMSSTFSSSEKQQTGAKSRDSFSSTSSLQFDWDELDKSEEQVPRDEESDEVSS